MKSTKKAKLGSLEHYQAFVEPVAGSFGRLVDEMEMLRPTTNALLRDRFSRSGQILGLLLVATPLLNQCVIHAHELLEGNGGLEGRDPKKINPSLRVLVHPFLEQNARSCRKLLKELKENLPPRRELIHRLEGVRQRPPLNYLQPAQPAFEQLIRRIRNDWAFLEARRDRLEDVRNKLSAHTEIAIMPSFFEEKEVQLFEHSLRPAFDDVWNALLEVVPPLGRAIAGLAHILIKANINFDDWRNSAARAAAAFWQFNTAIVDIPPPPPRAS